MHLVSSLSMADPVITPSSSAATSSNSTAYSSTLFRTCCSVSSGNSIWLSGTNCRQSSGQTSTHPPHRMHRDPSSSLPSNTVLIQQRKQRLASATAARSEEHTYELQ